MASQTPTVSHSLIPLSLLARLCIYGTLGWAIEAFTAVTDKIGGFQDDLRLLGYTYIWMFPIWAFGLYIAEQGGRWMKSINLFILLRWIVYMIVAFAIEYTSGWTLLVVTGKVPWHYSRGYHIHNLIQLEYAPGWVLTGIIAEALYPVLDSVHFHSKVKTH